MRDWDLVFPCGIGGWTLEDIEEGAKSILRIEDQRIIDLCLEEDKDV
jgi:hypothetical protein